MMFEDLLTRLENLVCDVVDRVLKSSVSTFLYDLNPVCGDVESPWLVLISAAFLLLVQSLVEPGIEGGEIQHSTAQLRAESEVFP